MFRLREVAYVEMQDGTRRTKRLLYWLLVREGSQGVEVMTTRPSGRLETLPVFSFREEAEMFLCLRGSQDGWHVRETAGAELLSMFYTVLKGVERVTLDPIPEHSFLDTFKLLTINRRDFVERLEMTSFRSRFIGKLHSSPWALDYR